MREILRARGMYAREISVYIYIYFHTVIEAGLWKDYDLTEVPSMAVWK